MRLLPTQKEIDNIKTEIISLHAKYDEALLKDKPFSYTREIYRAIKELEKKLEEANASLPVAGRAKISDRKRKQ